MRPTSNDYSFIQGKSNDGTEIIGEIAFNRTAATTGNLLFYTANGTNSLQRMQIHSEGDVGIGATPHTAGSTWRTLYVGSSATIISRQAATGTDMMLANNHYIDSSNVDKRITAGGTSRLFINEDVIRFQRSATGAADSTITWSESMRITADGDVGIGTTSPTNKLHIIDDSNPDANFGSVVIEGRRDGTANVLTLRARDASAPTAALPADQGTVIRFQGYDGGAGTYGFENMGYIAVQADGAAVGNLDAPSRMTFGVTPNNSGTPAEAMRISSTGNVGIGVTNPVNKLVVRDYSNPAYIEVDGSGSFDSGITFANNNVNKWYLLYDEGTDNLSIRGDGGGTDEFLVVGQSGNVGIGAASPVRRLHVAGGSGFAVNAGTGQYYGVYIPANGEGADPEIQIGDWHNAGARLQWDSSARSFNIDTQYSTGAGTFKITGNDFTETYLQVDNQGDVTVYNDLTVNGIVTAQEFHTEFVSASIVYRSGSTQFGDSSDDTHEFTGTVTINDATTANFANYDTNLLVGGDIIARSLTANEALIAIGGDSNGAYIKAGKQDASLTDRALNLITGEDIRVTVDTTGNLGIGTTAPTQLLHLVDNSTDVGIRIDNNATNGRDWFLYSRASSGINFSIYDLTAQRDRLGIDANGNVGIGVISPTELLHVSGGDGIINNAFFGEVPTYGITNAQFSHIDRAGAGEYSFLSANDGETYVNAKTGKNVNFRINNSTKAILDQNGNVGIGTTAPGAKLEVYGTGNTIRLDSAANGAKELLFRNVGTQTATIKTDGDLKLYVEDAGKNILFDTTGGEKMRILADGNVGIGSTAPTQKLDVNGYARASSGFVGSTTAKLFGDNTSTEFFAVNTNGTAQLTAYGSGTVTGTAAYNLQVDANGNIIETDVTTGGGGSGDGNVTGSGASNQVAYWANSEELAGSNNFTWNGSTLSINGTLEATEKSFVINHPTKEDKKLIYGVLEGPEHAVYCRGKINSEVLELPEEWTGLVDEESITVQLTSIGKHQNLYVTDIRDNKIFIKNGNTFSSKINAFYFVQGTRKDIKPLVTERDV